MASLIVNSKGQGQGCVLHSENLNIRLSMIFVFILCQFSLISGGDPAYITSTESGLLSSSPTHSTAAGDIWIWTTTPTVDPFSSFFNESMANATPTSTTIVHQSRYNLLQMIIIAWVASCLGILTVMGNILVMISFKIDKQLQTISNYFLFSLAVADFVIGSVSMPLFTIYLLLGYWPFGSRLCDSWLALDYLASNASVLNLLIISFDRYFSVTRPLTYRARRTTKRAAVMISSAWGISLLLWPPWIYAWPYIEGKRTVPQDACYIQFIETNHYITFGTAIMAFYVPVSIMLFLYWQIWRETEKRQRDLSSLQAGKKDSSRRSNSSDEAVDYEDWKRNRSESCICPDHLEKVKACPAHRRQSRVWRWLRSCASVYVACRGFCRIDKDPDDVEEVEDEHTNSPGCITPASIETPLQSSVSRCTSLNVIRDPLAQTPTRRDTTSTTTATTTANTNLPPTNSTVAVVPAVVIPAVPSTPSNLVQTTPSSEGSNGRLPSSESVYTILIRIPQETEGKNVSIRMIQEPGPLPPLPIHPGRAAAKLAGETAGIQVSTVTGGRSGSEPPGGNRRPSSTIPPLNAKVIAKPLTTPVAGRANAPQTPIVPPAAKKKKKKNLEKKQDKKAAKTLSAILLAFVITWTPYNILVLLRTILSKEDAIPPVLWDMAYYLCYINSTINPMCYALCNASFRRTYVRILTCKWDNSRRQGVNRAYYN